MIKKLDKRVLLSSPTMHGEEMNYVKEAFDRNWIAPLGFNCDGFEREMSAYLKDEVFTFATASGTSALHLAMKLAGLKRGDHVLCSDMTFAATVNPIAYEGGKHVFIDSEYETWNMDPEALEKGFEKYPDAKIVVLAHLYGTPSKMDEILAVCKKHGAILIEDAAEALSSNYKGIRCGTFGEYNALSFNGNKIITTSGGGMLITKTAEARSKALFWSTQAREQAPWYQHEDIGFNYRMSNVVAGIGRGQLKHLEEHRERKEAIYRRYEKGLEGYPVKMNPYLEDTRPNFWLSCLTIDKDAMCPQIRTDKTTTWEHQSGKTCPDEMAAKLLECNVETRPIWKPMHMQPYYADCDFISTGVGEDIFNRGICLPSDIKMTRDEQDAVIEIIKSCFEK
ncbi:MAG: aminotransferase class V-fold PLP-dependent enzyme [Clostridiales bacterium]|nr:aminotransferase class V-fold PLP-dependent enzyme [Candidatus Equinaster intestinalis]